MSLVVIGFILIPFIFFLNFLVFKLLIKRAVNKYVKPELQKRGLTLVNYKWVGFWGCGDFKKDEMEFALFKTGFNSISIYSFIYYRDFNVDKRLTVKINVVDLSINEVIYSNGF